MKRLDVNQMEDVRGATDQRNCMIIGGVIAGSTIAGFFTAGIGWGVAVGAVLTAANSNCF